MDGYQFSAGNSVLILIKGVHCSKDVLIPLHKDCSGGKTMKILHILLSIIFILVFLFTNSFAEIVFQDDFNGHSDWTLVQPPMYSTSSQEVCWQNCTNYTSSANCCGICTPFILSRKFNAPRNIMWKPPARMWPLPKPTSRTEAMPLPRRRRLSPSF